MKAQWIGWVGVCCSFSGMTLQALHTSADRYSFVIFLVGNYVWLYNGVLTRNRALAFSNAVASFINIVAIIHWFT